MPKIDALLDDLVKRGGTDLHLAGGYSPLARIRGELVPLRDGLVEAKELEEVLFELVTQPQRGRLSAQQDLVFTHPHRDIARFRASYFQKHGGLAATFRLVPARVLTLAELGCPEVLWRVADLRSGLVLVSGPMSSGKSTTVAALIDHINKTRACHILTIEDPVEAVHEPLRAQISQREVHVHAPSVLLALKNASREDADVVLVSDVSEPASLELAARLAGRGALVFAMMTANGALAALEQSLAKLPEASRIPMRSLFADTLAAVIGQQLVRTVDGKGRIAAHEILMGSPTVSDLIREGKLTALTNVMQSGHASGMATLDSALERLLSGGRISAQDALDRAIDREAFAQTIAKLRPDLAEALG